MATHAVPEPCLEVPGLAREHALRRIRGDVAQVDAGAEGSGGAGVLHLEREARDVAADAQVALAATRSLDETLTLGRDEEASAARWQERCLQEEIVVRCHAATRRGHDARVARAVDHGRAAVVLAEVRNAVRVGRVTAAIQFVTVERTVEVAVDAKPDLGAEGHRRQGDGIGRSGERHERREGHLVSRTVHLERSARNIGGSAGKARDASPGRETDATQVGFGSHLGQERHRGRVERREVHDGHLGTDTRMGVLTRGSRGEQRVIDVAIGQVRSAEREHECNHVRQALVALKLERGRRKEGRERGDTAVVQEAKSRQDALLRQVHPDLLIGAPELGNLDRLVR